MNLLTKAALADGAFAMSKISELLTLAEVCFAQACDTADPETRRVLRERGDQYLGEANRHWLAEANSRLIPALAYGKMT